MARSDYATCSETVFRVLGQWAGIAINWHLHMAAIQMPKLHSLEENWTKWGHFGGWDRHLPNNSAIISFNKAYAKSLCPLCHFVCVCVWVCVCEFVLRNPSTMAVWRRFNLRREMSGQQQQQLHFITIFQLLLTWCGLITGLGVASFPFAGWFIVINFAASACLVFPPPLFIPNCSLALGRHFIRKIVY